MKNNQLDREKRCCDECETDIEIKTAPPQTKCLYDYHCVCHTSPSKENWEEEFDKEFVIDGFDVEIAEYGYAGLDDEDIVRLKSFISKNFIHRERLIKEIEKLREYKLADNPPEVAEVWKVGQESALDDILEIIDKTK
jgi:hypothetical protein